ncbi:MAG: stalk domain-containing protein [Defluviitaleaceae bacterium]|nr:stalk domain-containing protein [Defluviitaleaceae bacterium]
MKKMFFCLAMMAMVIFVSSAVAYANTAIDVVVNGERVTFTDQEPVVVDGRTLVPVRGVFEMLGFEVEWESATSTAVLTSENHTVKITIGQSTFFTNGVAHTLDVPAQSIGGRTMVPLRLPLESIGYYLDWCGSMRRVAVTSVRVTAGFRPVGRPTILPGQGIPTPEQVAEWYNTFIPTEYEWLIFNAINEARVHYGQSVLEWCNIRASRAALRTAYLESYDVEYLRASGYTSHRFGSFISFDTLGVEPTPPYVGGGIALHRAQFRWRNRANSYMDLDNGFARWIVGGWLNSPGHRAIVLDPARTHVGIGVGIDLHDYVILTYLF